MNMRNHCSSLTTYSCTYRFTLWLWRLWRQLIMILLLVTRLIGFTISLVVDRTVHRGVASRGTGSCSVTQ